MINLQDKPFNLTNNEQEWVNQKLHTLTDEEKSGLLFVILGDAFSPSKLEEIVKKGVGGILFRPNEAKTIVRKKSSFKIILAFINLLRQLGRGREWGLNFIFPSR